MLRLETQRGAMFVALSGLPRDAAVEKVAGVELDAGLCGAHVEVASGFWIDETRGVNETDAASIQHPIVIVPAAVAQLRVRLVNARADVRRDAEIEWRSPDRRDLARRNERRIDGRELRCIERQTMVENVDASRAVEVPVRVLRAIDRRRLVRRRLVVYDQLAARGEAVRHAPREVA